MKYPKSVFWCLISAQNNVQEAAFVLVVGILDVFKSSFYLDFYNEIVKFWNSIK